jgi:hypothetical protein
MIAAAAMMHLGGYGCVHGRHRDHHILLGLRGSVIWVDYCYELCIRQGVSKGRSSLILLR